jgi:solute carrier family 35 protein E1
MLNPVFPSPSLLTFRFSSLCSLWYTSSAVSSNTAKSIFSSGFKFPVTLTLVQFAFIALYCFLWTRPILRMAVLREPTKALVRLQ